MNSEFKSQILVLEIEPHSFISKKERGAKTVSEEISRKREEEDFGKKSPTLNHFWILTLCKSFLELSPQYFRGNLYVLQFQVLYSKKILLISLSLRFWIWSRSNNRSRHVWIFWWKIILTLRLSKAQFTALRKVKS